MFIVFAEFCKYRNAPPNRGMADYIRPKFEGGYAQPHGMYFKQYCDRIITVSQSFVMHR